MHVVLPAFVTIPATPFLIGTPEQDLSDLARRYGGTRESYREESPQHTLTLPSFALARVPVTNRLYGAYVAASGVQPPLRWRTAEPPPALLDHPVVDVSWEDAQAFCAWLTGVCNVLHVVPPSGGLPAASEGGITELYAQSALSGSDHVAPPTFRLPTEAEWEHAARGNDGRLFPWGDQFDLACANTRETGQSTTSVGSFAAGASPYGLLDMAGNVWEWTATLDRLYPYVADDGREDLTGSGRRILRGGCYANPQGFARCACRFRLPPGTRSEFIGFRIAV